MSESKGHIPRVERLREQVEAETYALPGDMIGAAMLGAAMVQRAHLQEEMRDCPDCVLEAFREEWEAKNRQARQNLENEAAWRAHMQSLSAEDYRQKSAMEDDADPRLPEYFDRAAEKSRQPSTRRRWLVPGVVWVLVALAGLAAWWCRRGG